MGATTATKGRRARRSAADISAIRDAIIAALEVDRPMTVRQVFYRLVSMGSIDKTEDQYKGTVTRLLGEMRVDGTIPFSWIADNTRAMRKPRTAHSLAKMLKLTQDTYRRAIWDNQEVYVEVWLEKDALSGVLWDVTSTYDVPLMVTRGYPSMTFLHHAAMTIEAWNRPTHLYFFGDWDPSGADISKTTERSLKRYAPGAEIHFTRAALNPDQIASMGLVTRPTKKSDSRAKNFKGESVEVDAIPPRTLKTMVERCITKHIDRDSLDQLRAVEKAEREVIGDIAGADWTDRVQVYLDNPR